MTSQRPLSLLPELFPLPWCSALLPQGVFFEAGSLLSHLCVCIACYNLLLGAGPECLLDLFKAMHWHVSQLSSSGVSKLSSRGHPGALYCPGLSASELYPPFLWGWQVYHLLRHHRCFPLNKIQWDNIEKLLPHRWHWRSFSKWFLVHTLSPSHSFLALKQFSEFQPRIMASRSVIRDVIAYPHSICFKLEILVTPASPIIIFNWCNYPSACSCYKSCILSLLYSSLFSVFAMCSFSL